MFEHGLSPDVEMDDQHSNPDDSSDGWDEYLGDRLARFRNKSSASIDANARVTPVSFYRQDCQAVQTPSDFSPPGSFPPDSNAGFDHDPSHDDGVVGEGGSNPELDVDTHTDAEGTIHTDEEPIPSDEPQPTAAANPSLAVHLARMELHPRSPPPMPDAHALATTMEFFRGAIAVLRGVERDADAEGKELDAASLKLKRVIEGYRSGVFAPAFER